MDLPLRRPTATARRLLAVAQVVAALAVLGAAWAAGVAVQAHLDSRAAQAAVALVEVPTPLAAGPAEHDGVLAGIGTLVVGWTLVGAAGTVARRRVEERESARWEREWAAVEPAWSGRA